MRVCFVSDQQPLSIQATPKKLNRYKQRMRQEFEDYKHLFSDLPIVQSLYSKVIYIHSKSSSTDVDNLSKPFIDTFKGIVYPDDSIINHRTCSKISFDDFESYEFQLDLLPIEIFEKLDKLITNKSPHIIYFEVGLFTTEMVFFGGVKNEAQ